MSRHLSSHGNARRLSLWHDEAMSQNGSSDDDPSAMCVFLNVAPRDDQHDNDKYNMAFYTTPPASTVRCGTDRLLQQVGHTEPMPCWIGATTTANDGPGTRWADRSHGGKIVDESQTGSPLSAIVLANVWRELPRHLQLQNKSSTRACCGFFRPAGRMVHRKCKGLCHFQLRAFRRSGRWTRPVRPE
jgi:hypothetical protein